MSNLRVRFTIRGLMIAVIVAALAMALPGASRVVVAALGVPCLALFAARWLFWRGRRRIAGFCFWGPGLVANVLYIALTIVPGEYMPFLLGIAWFVLVGPSLAGFGVTWAILGAAEGVSRRRSALAWCSVFLLSIMPYVTAATVWPLRLAFLAARPALERLADRVAAGKPVTYPRSVGPFRVAAASVDPASGNIALMIDPDPNGPRGFVRTRPRQDGRSGCFRPIRGDVSHISLDRGWCYHEED